MLHLVPNRPLDLGQLAALLADKDDLALVWPEARHPFDAEQWRARLTERPGNASYFVSDGTIIGHAALLDTGEAGVLAVSFLFIRSDRRARGYGRRMMALLEDEAKALGAAALRLRVRSYNPRAAHVYEAAGFVVMEQEGTLRIMRKGLAG